MSRPPNRTRRRGLLALPALALALAALQPADVEARSALRECTDGAWANYNGCLMEGSGWFHRQGCDTEFSLSYSACYVKFYKDTF